MLVVLVVTFTFAESVARTLTPFGDVPLAVATFLKLLVTVVLVHEYVFDLWGAMVPSALLQA